MTNKKKLTSLFITNSAKETLINSSTIIELLELKRNHYLKGFPLRNEKDIKNYKP